MTEQEQKDRKTIAQYRAWLAEFEALEAIPVEIEWTTEQHDRHGELWGLIFSGKDDVVDAALRLITE